MAVTATRFAEFIGAGSYSWTCPTGVTSIFLTMIAGGAGGSSGWSQNGGSGNSAAGGSGEYCVEFEVKVTPGSSYAIVVGRGGTGGASTHVPGGPIQINSGTNGTLSSFWNTVVNPGLRGTGGTGLTDGGNGGGITGGRGGRQDQPRLPVPGTQIGDFFGGSGGGDTGWASGVTQDGAGSGGFPGGSGGDVSGLYVGGAGGGASPWGKGGNGGNTGTTGSPGTAPASNAYGAGGGSGAASTAFAGNTGAGGSGMDGYVLVEWVENS